MLKLVVILILILASLAIGASEAPIWKVRFVPQQDRIWVERTASFVLEDSQYHMAQVQVSVLPVPENMPRTEAQWQDYVAAFLAVGPNTAAVKKALINKSRTAFITETTYHRGQTEMMAKVLVLVDKNSLLIFHYDDYAAAFVDRNEQLYKKLFQDLAFGHREDVVQAILKH
jgi:hypothetical protein